jgi:hypothetical protein
VFNEENSVALFQNFLEKTLRNFAQEIGASRFRFQASSSITLSTRTSTLQGKYFK